MAKKAVKSLLCAILLFLLFSANVSADTMSAKDAEDVVKGFLKLDSRPMGMELGDKVSSVEAVFEGEDVLYYVVYLAPSGFVIVSADDEIEPIIAFSSGLVFDSSDSNPLGALLHEDMPGRYAAKAAKRVGKGKQLRQFELKKSRKQNRWNGFRAVGLKGNGNGAGKKKAVTEALSDFEEFLAFADNPFDGMSQMPAVSDVRVDFLVKSTWSQGNACGVNCFDFNTPNHYSVGCVATAMSQVIRYHEYPTAGIGVISCEIRVDGNLVDANTLGGDGLGGPYDYSNMLLNPDDECPLTLTERRAIGTLCRDAGLSVGMHYTSGQSGAYVSNVDNGFRDIFGYAKGNSFTMSTGSDYLCTILNSNLQAGLPCVLGALEHAVVVDGYGYNTGIVYHHMNMGWGEGSDNAWYDLTEYSGYCTLAYNLSPYFDGEIVCGELFDSAGAPVSGATVTAIGGGYSYSDTTDANGIFLFTDVEPNIEYVISSQNCEDVSLSMGQSGAYPANEWLVMYVNKVVNQNTGYSSLSIQDVINNASAGDIIVVPDIEFDEVITINKNIALRSSDPTNSEVVENTIISNSSGASGITVSSDCTINGLTITGCGSSGGVGGGINITAGSPNIKNCVLDDNIAACGGAVSCGTNCVPTFENCTFSNNTATYVTGAVDTGMNYIIFSKCKFYDNTSNSSGGAVSCMNGAEFFACEFKDNTATSGGAIMNQGTLKIYSSAFMTNSSSSAGGAVCNYGGSLKVTNCSFLFNSADEGGGIYSYNGGTPCVMNSLFYGNTANTGNTTSGTLPQFNSSAIDNSYLNGSTIYENTTNVQIGTLQEGPFIGSLDTMSDYHLGQFSPCIDVGLCASDIGCISGGELAYITYGDPDGDGRLLYAFIDIGADEFVDNEPPVPSSVEWDVEPYFTEPNTFTMTAVEADDFSEPIEYYFTSDEITARSDWQESNTYEVSLRDDVMSRNGSYTFQVKARDSEGNETSYSEESTVILNIDPPTPNPMTWEISPYFDGLNKIIMKATTAYDPNGPVIYCFNGYFATMIAVQQADPNFVYEVDQNGTCFITVQAKDSFGNVTEPTTNVQVDVNVPCFYPAPDPMSFSSAPNAVSPTAITMTAVEATDCRSLDIAYYFENVTDDPSASVGHDSGWQISRTYSDTGLVPGGTYYYRVKARNSIENETGYSSSLSATTLTDTTAPSPDPMTFSTGPYGSGATTVTMIATTASDDSGVVEYYFNAYDPSHDSGWQSSSSYTDTGLSPGSNYSYRVKARDAYGNETAYSASQGGTTLADTTAPSPDPMSWSTSPYATGMTSVSMTASLATDDYSGPVEYYFDCYMGGHDSGWQTSRTYADTGLSPGTAYNYRVKARDSVGNETAYCTSVAVTTDSDTTAPTPNPMTFTMNPFTNGPTSLVFLATSASDVSGPVEYYFDVYYGDHDSGWQSSPNYEVTGLDPGTTYWGRVKARDAYGNETSYSSTYSVATQADTTAPTPNPMSWSTNPYATGMTSVSMTASLATDDYSDPVEYYFYAYSGGHSSGWQTSRTYVDTGLSAGTTYSYKVKARDAEGNYTSYSSTKSVTTQSDTTAPTPNPMSWSSSPYATGMTSVSMIASSALDPSGPVEYYFDNYMGGHDSGWQTSRMYSDTGLSPGTSYNYRVKARDAYGNETAYCTSVSVTTDADTTPPTPNPMTWAGTPFAIGTSIVMAATTATDDFSGPVEYYFSSYGGHTSGWQSSPNYYDVGCPPNTTCYYVVKARDAEGNETSYSSVGYATTGN